MNFVQRLVRSEGNTWVEECIIADISGQEDHDEEDPLEKYARMDASDSDNEGDEVG